METRVFIADDDPFLCKVLEKTLTPGGFSVEIVHRGTDALERLSLPDAPRLALVDWMMPGMSGIEVCRALRKTPHGSRIYLFLMSGRQRQEDFLEGFEAGADDFAAKPFEPQVLLARLQAVARRLHNEEPRGAQALLKQLIEAGKGATGEVVVRDRDRVGHVVFHQGKIAWVHVSGGRFLMPLMVQLGLAEADVRAVLEECRNKRLPFMDTLVSWGLVDRAVLQEHMRMALSKQLASLLASGGTTFFFVPGEAQFESGFAFELSELEPELLMPVASPPPLPTPLPTVAPEEHERLATAVAKLDGVDAVVLLDKQSGMPLLSRGSGYNDDLVRGMVRLVAAEAGKPIQKLWAVGNDHYHVLDTLSDVVMVYALVDRQKNPNLALFQLNLRGVIEGFSRG